MLCDLVYRRAFAGAGLTGNLDTLFVAVDATHARFLSCNEVVGRLALPDGCDDAWLLGDDPGCHMPAGWAGCIDDIYQRLHRRN